MNDSVDYRYIKDDVKYIIDIPHARGPSLPHFSLHHEVEDSSDAPNTPVLGKRATTENIPFP